MAGTNTAPPTPATLEDPLASLNTRGSSGSKRPSASSSSITTFLQYSLLEKEEKKEGTGSSISPTSSEGTEEVSDLHHFHNDFFVSLPQI